jgi:hypothetical protein
VTAASIVIAAFCALWLVQATLVIRHLRQIRDLAEMTPPDPMVWPSVSVVSAARDEAVELGASLTSRLGDGYLGPLEIIVVDDRSSDDTPRILAEFATADGRVHPLRIDELPAGWLGKVHALARGTEAATGEWLLFSDADVIVEPGMLGKAVAHCEAERLDLLALVPEFRSRSGIVEVLWAIFMRVMTMSISPAGVRDPSSRVVMGSGGYTLVRRSAFDSTPGFEHLRLETADDVSLALMVKNAGGRCDFVNGRRAVSVSLYDTLGEFYRGVEKNGSSLAGVPFWLVMVVFVLLGCVEYSPLVATIVGVAGGMGWLAWLGVATTLLATAATAAALNRTTGLVWPALLWPVGWALMASGVLRSAWLFHRRGGALWRGTFYSKAEVLDAQRFKLG